MTTPHSFGDAVHHFYLHQPGNKASGCVLVSDGKPLRFRNRKDALSYVMRRCYQDGATEGEPVINIEGSDGRWRAFDCRLMPYKGELLPSGASDDAVAPDSTGFH